MVEKTTICTFCDGGCAVTVQENGGELKIRPANSGFPAICKKAAIVDEYRLHPDRITVPLRRSGAKGSGKFEQISWEEALDEIAGKLSGIIDESGPEAFAVSEMALNHGFGGLTRRFMNHLGSPNYITALELCMGNTFQVHRAIYGGATVSDWAHADCVVYFGQDRDMERWPAEYLNLKAAKERGALLIEVDPRNSATARMADWHLPIRYGTDAALALGWINVILEEGLYDKAFVESQCEGFEALREHIGFYIPEAVAEICGIDADVIRETARVYANSNAAIIPWGVTGDMQVNSTSLLQAQCILRAICGFLGKSEKVMAPVKGIVTNSEISSFELLDEVQRSKQLGAESHPLLTSRAGALYKSALEREQIPYEPDILATSNCAVPSSVFAAMRGEGPYRVRALFSVANNTLMSYAGQKGIQEALQALDLVVVFENWMTPTAQLADYVLPGDMWAERDVLLKPFDVAPVVQAGQACRPRVGECRSWFFVIKGLADRMGLSDAFPWEDEHAFFDWRLKPAGITYSEACERFVVPGTPYPLDGWLTPSGKVELASSVLESLGFDAVPSFRDPVDIGASEHEYPYLAFAGSRERANYNTALRQIESLRKDEPEPRFFINPDDAELEEIAEGQWCSVESAHGRSVLSAHLDEAQPLGTIRVPHGWWKPETESGIDAGLSGAAIYNDGLLFPDDEWNLDGPQGVPGLRGSIRVRIAPQPCDA